MTNFLTLQTLLNGTDSHNGTLINAIEEYQSSLHGYKTVTDLYEECYWFESRLWWRAGPRMGCLPEELGTKTDSTVDQAELKALTDHIKGTSILLLLKIQSHSWKKA